MTTNTTSTESTARTSSLKHRSTLRIGLFGFGVVGTGVWKILQDKRDSFSAAYGTELEVGGICVRELAKARDVSVPAGLITDRIEELLADPTIDIVLELIGGRFEAQAVIERSLRARKHVITANKLVLSHELPRLRTIADRNGVNLFYSASVCGSVPVLRALDELNAGDTILKVSGIVNGSTNFILGRMSEGGLSYEDAMLEARRFGFLEADPTLDVSGADAAQKLSVLTVHAFGTHLPPHEIATTGIEHITTSDIKRAREDGKTIKLIASAARDASGVVRGTVRPELIPIDHIFANTRDEYNALEILTQHAGPQILYGKGAGSLPTASAVISDLIEVLRQE